MSSIPSFAQMEVVNGFAADSVSIGSSSYQFGSGFWLEDLNGAILYASGGHIRIDSSGSSAPVALQASSGGNVGVGTASPGAKLDVEASGSGAWDAGRIFLGDTSNGKKWQLSNRGSSDSGNQNKFMIHHYDGSSWTSALLTVDLSGNVGIGTTSPQDVFHVSRSSYAPIVLSDTSQATNAKTWRIANASAQLQFAAINDAYSSGTDVMVLTRSGNVGIGTTSPAAMLHVSSPAGTIGVQIPNSNGTDTTYFNYTDGKNWIRGTTILADNGGNVGIGTTSPGYTLTVAGTAWGTSGSWSGSSRDFKEGIVRVPEGEHASMLDTLLELDLSRYRYKQELGGDGSTRLGFIAEEMPLDVLSPDGKGVDVYGLVTYVVGGLKALYGRLSSLETSTREAARQTDARLVACEHAQSALADDVAAMKREMAAMRAELTALHLAKN